LALAAAVKTFSTTGKSDLASLGTSSSVKRALPSSSETQVTISFIAICITASLPSRSPVRSRSSASRRRM
jgi:hypothetical protein